MRTILKLLYLVVGAIALVPIEFVADYFLLWALNGESPRVWTLVVICLVFGGVYNFVVLAFIFWHDPDRFIPKKWRK